MKLTDKIINVIKLMNDLSKEKTHITDLRKKGITYCDYIYRTHLFILQKCAIRDIYKPFIYRNLTCIHLHVRSSVNLSI